MMLRIDPNSTTPPFEQLRQQFAGIIATGQLPAGARLPTVRKLAGDLGLAPNTVARTYRELESDGLIETRGRLGSFVALSDEASQRGAHAAAAHFLERLRELGIDPVEAPSYLRLAMAQTAPASPPLN